MIEAAGGVVVWLPPYCPELSPIEKAFRLIKNYFKDHGNELSKLGPYMQLDTAFGRIGPEHALHCFKACKYC